MTVFKDNKDYSDREVFIIGVKHDIQWNGGINFRTSNLKKKGLSEAFLKEDQICMKRMRSDMRELCRDFNPDLVVEEGGPYLNTQADIWKKNIAGKKILLEEDYGDRHIFADAKALLVGGKLAKPSDEEREQAIGRVVMDKIAEQSAIKKVCLVVGGIHAVKVGEMIKTQGVNIRVRDLNKEDYIKRLDELFDKEKKKIFGK